MSKKVVVAILVIALASVGSAIGQTPEAPNVVSWSNSKTEDAKTVFKVKPGRKITFSVKADGAEKSVWLVDGVVHEGAGATSFQWTVPNRKGMWKILVKTTNKAREKWAKEELKHESIKGWIERLKCPKNKYGHDGTEKERFLRDMVDINVYPEKARKEWIVATTMTRVKPGESIQKAIDSLPSEGGIVELAPGTHEVNDTMYPLRTFQYAYRDSTFRYSILIKRSNVTIYGTRKSIVRHHNNQINCFFIPDLVDTAPDLWVENVTFRGFTMASAYTRRGQGKYNQMIKGHHVKNFTVEDVYDTSRAALLVNVGCAPNAFGTRMRRRSENVYVKNNITETAYIYGSYCKHVYQINNTVKRAHAGWSPLGLEERCTNVHIVGNEATGAMACLTVLAGAPLWNVRDNVCKGGKWGIWIGSYIAHRLVINNTVKGATQAGIYSRPGRHDNILIINNRIYNNAGVPGKLERYPGHGVWFSKHTPGNMDPRNSEESLIGNVIYNNAGDGVRLDYYQWKLITVTGNIIVNNKGYGINRVDEGMKSTIVLSHNDVWRNAKGDYNGASAGTGDISVDPLFADPAKGDFRLKSKAGRWDPKAKKWVKDAVSSPCIDAGDPKADYSKEPDPNGGRVNIGAYGNTEEASKSLRK